MPSYLMLALAFAGAAVVTFALTPLVAKLASRLGIVDRPDDRKLHAEPVPHLGGVAILLGLAVGALVFGVVKGWDALLKLFSDEHYLSLLVPCLIIFAVGLVDDIHGLAPIVRVVAECVAAAMLVQAGFVIESVWTPFGDPIELGLLAYPISLLWIVGATNAFNLIDGLDGLLASVGLASLLGCAVVSRRLGMVGTPVLALAFAGALAGFLPWNWHRARVFLGDSGSLLIGFGVAALSVRASTYDTGGVALHVLLVLCAVPVIETFLTLARRYVNAKPLFAPDMGHIHHVLVNHKGLTVPRAVGVLAGMQVLFSAMAVFSRMRLEWYSLVPVGAFVVIIAILVRWLGYVEMCGVWHHVKERLFFRHRRHLGSIVELARAGEFVGKARSGAELKSRLREAVDACGMAYLALELSEVGARLLSLEESARECRNAAATEYLALRDGRPTWLASSAPEDPDEAGGAASAGMTISVSLPVEDGRYGRLVCHRGDVLRHPGPSARDVQRLLAGPIVDVLECLERSAGGNGSHVGGTGSPAQTGDA